MISTGEGESSSTKEVVLNVKLNREKTLPLILNNANVISGLVYEHTCQILGSTETCLKGNPLHIPEERQCRRYIYYHYKGIILARVQHKWLVPHCYTGANVTHRSLHCDGPVDMVPVTLFDPKAPGFQSGLPKEDELLSSSFSHDVDPTLSDITPKFSIFGG